MPELPHQAGHLVYQRGVLQGPGHEEEEVVVEEEIVNPAKNGDQPMPWKCGVCTLENEALNYFCDACNSPSPLHAARKNKTKEEVITGAGVGADPNMELGIILSKAVR